MTDTNTDKPDAPKPVKAKGPHSGTVIVITGAFDVRKPSILEEAVNAFKFMAEEKGIKLTAEPRLIKINHRVGKSAEFTFEAD